MLFQQIAICLCYTGNKLSLKRYGSPGLEVVKKPPTYASPLPFHPTGGTKGKDHGLRTIYSNEIRKWIVTATTLIIEGYKREWFTCKNGYCRPCDNKQHRVPSATFSQQEETSSCQKRVPSPCPVNDYQVIENNLYVLAMLLLATTKFNPAPARTRTVGQLETIFLNLFLVFRNFKIFQDWESCVTYIFPIIIQALVVLYITWHGRRKGSWEWRREVEPGMKRSR